METTAAGTSQPKLRTSHRAAAVAANAHMAAQALEEEAPLGVVMAKALSSPPAKVNTPAPSQGKHNHLGKLLSAALGDDDTKKRAPESLPPAPKRSKTTAKSMPQKAAQGAAHRGKKRRPAPYTYEASMEASPIITDLPPLPFTTPEVPKKKYKIRKVAPLKEADAEASRPCEFCKKVANICVPMHCHSCRRVYHAGCFVHAFKACVDAQTPILDQMETLQLKAPDRKGNIFRCASCKAAFLDFYESDGYLWDCDCPTCSQPEKKIYYRQRKLVQMMNEMELEKQLKKEKKGQSKPAAAKTPPTSSRSNSTARSRRTRGSSGTPVDQAVKEEGVYTTVKSEKEQVKSERRTESMDVDSKSQEKDTNDKSKLEENDEKIKTQKVAEAAENQPQIPSSDSMTSKDAVELTGDELVHAVRVLHDEKGGRWSFPVMCSRTSSLHVSGMMKTGSCKWSRKKSALIQCDCCDRLFNFSEFVHHTDSALVKDAKCATEDPMPFLFVEHRNNTQHSPLEAFLPALRSWLARQSTNNTPTKTRKSRNVKPEPAETPTIRDPEVDAAVSRLRSLALFKRPKHRNDKSSTAARLADAEAYEFVAHVVCLSPNYVMNMANGALADRVVRSKTAVPGGSFPRKSGWLTFKRDGVKARQITCVCCEKRFVCEELVNHAGISQTELTKTPRQLLYVVERQDESALMPYMKFAKDLEAAATNNLLAALLNELHLPPPSPRPLEL